MRSINCAYLIEAADKPVAAQRQIQIDAGRVRGIGDAEAADSAALFALPSLVNAHDHGRAIRTSSFNASGKPLESWIQYQALIPSLTPISLPFLHFRVRRWAGWARL